MKKVLVTLLIVLVSATSVFAVDFNYQDAAYLSAMGAPFTKTSARVAAMGGAGLAVFNNQDSLYLNPASLGGKGLVFNLPNAAFTLYNIKTGYVDSGIFDQLLDDPGKFTDTDFLMDNVLGGVLDMLGTAGRNRVATVDAGIGFKAGRFALGIDTQVNLNTYLPVGSGTTDIQLVPQVDVAATAGLGFRFFRDNAINFDVGVSAQLNIRAFMQAFDAQTLISAFTNSEDDSNILDSVLGGQPVAIGWALPLSFGINVNFPFGFTISSTLSNVHLIKGGYNYVVQENYEAFTDDPLHAILSPFTEDTQFTVKSGMMLNLGFGWSPDLGGFEWIIDPTVAIDLVDINGLVKDWSTTNLLARVRAGVELQLFKAFELRAGLNGGYVSVGAGVNLFNVIHLEASYYWNEFGDVLGEKDVDALTIRMNIGWER